MDRTIKIITINPGSTTTKIAMFENDTKVFSMNIDHLSSELEAFAEISDQLEYRKKMIVDAFESNGFDVSDADAYVGRGGGQGSIGSGTYVIDDLLLEKVRNSPIKHPATLGSQIAYGMAQEFGGQSFIVNPPDVDEFQDVARMTGVKGVYRESKLHALNQKEVAIRYADSLGKNYNALNLVVAHIGGGVSVTAHKKGRMIDSNDIVQGDGPMAPTRAGALPVSDVIRMCFSGDYTERDLKNLLTKNGGFVSHLGTSDAREVRKAALDGDAYAALVYDAMVYQIAKYIGSCAVVLDGKVDAILLTGGMVNEPYIVNELTSYTGWIAPIHTTPGEFEMEGLAHGALMVMTGKDEARTYSGKPVWTGFNK